MIRKIWTNFQQIVQLFEKKQKRNYLFLWILIIFSSVIEMAGIGAISPLLELVMHEGDIQELPIYIQRFSSFANWTGKDLVLGVAFIFIALTLLKNFLGIFTLAKTSKFTTRIYRSLSRNILAQYLLKDYAWHLKQNTGDFTRIVVNEVNNVVRGILHNTLIIITNALIAMGLIILVALQNWKAAIITGLMLSVIFGSIFIFFKGRLRFLGKTRYRMDQQRFTLLNNAFGGIKEVKMTHSEDYFLSKYSKISARIARISIRSDVYSVFPRYIVESLVFTFFALMVALLFFQGKNLSSLIPSLSIYLLAGYRLLPTFQNITRASNSVLSNLESYKNLKKDLQRPLLSNHSCDESPVVSFQNEIVLEKIRFSHGSNDPIFENFNLKVKAKERIGIVGFSGSGKTTLLNLILGFWVPHEGSLIVDGISLKPKDLDCWRNNIGLVSQDIFLLDGTIKENIAYGVASEDINMDALLEAAKLAELEPIIEKLALGYDNPVGERGLQLSGGQAQRIAIARALYRKPRILIFDEATSAMDNLTEKAIMDSLERLNGKMTIIIVAHRLSTVEKCDRIIVLDQGNIVGEGNYKDLIAHNEPFQRLALQEQE